MASNRKVLIIEDEAPIRRAIALKLKNRGCKVIVARDGKEGYDLIKKERPEVVITDIMMPKMDGQTLCEKTNDLKKEWNFLTIIITARISPNEHLWVEQMQDTLFMEKPFSPAKMVEHIDDYFSVKN